MAKNPVSQSDTRWVKKTGKKGYVEQISTGKRVTGRVALVKDTTKGKAGSTQRYKKGTGLKQTGAKPAAAGGGRKPGRASTSSAPSPSASAPTVTKVKVGTVRRGAAGRQDNRWNGTKWVPVKGSSDAARISAAANAKAKADSGIKGPSTTADLGTSAKRAANANRPRPKKTATPAVPATVGGSDRRIKILEWKLSTLKQQAKRNAENAAGAAAKVAQTKKDAQVIAGLQAQINAIK